MLTEWWYFKGWWRQCFPQEEDTFRYGIIQEVPKKLQMRLKLQPHLLVWEIIASSEKQTNKANIYNGDGIFLYKQKLNNGELWIGG